MPSLHLTGDPVADRLLSRDANALLIGMLLDQQVPMEKVFSGPALIAERMGGDLDVHAIASADPDSFAALCAERPAVHRFPRAMAARIQELCRILVTEWQGSGADMLASAATGAELKARLASLPGFGDAKASILVALVGKQYGIAPEGWREAAGEFGLPGYRSVADIVDAESLARVREAKKATKAAGR